MREVDFRHLRAALESLNSSTDLVLVRGRVRATLSHQCSSYVSRRRMRFDLAPQPLGDDVLLAVNYRKILLVGLTADPVAQAAETIGRDGRPFDGDLLGPDSGQRYLGWDGPWARWVVEPVSSGLPMLQGLIRVAHEYGLVSREWMEAPLLHAAWLVPVVMEWDEDGRPVFSWPDRPSESESETVDQDLPVEV